MSLNLCIFLLLIFAVKILYNINEYLSTLNSYLEEFLLIILINFNYLFVNGNIMFKLLKRDNQFVKNNYEDINVLNAR
ncbi:hypothetical protein T552_04199 [Pneumocystis carinii B80]|uniref:Uncharacterized protein n=1 Tax=Pneumocystis carinii (strain B80) TaxID=1408658 RepID=A0A0W4ZCW1_PNEC8|nr:hypothetical protein T552_04199 [Pneumocystis carinii B80]KTW26204.1 hypothetical protein T552_04199 [Pneumocystis carinii B80]